MSSKQFNFRFRLFKNIYKRRTRILSANKPLPIAIKTRPGGRITTTTTAVLLDGGGDCWGVFVQNTTIVDSAIGKKGERERERERERVKIINEATLSLLRLISQW